MPAKTMSEKLKDYFNPEQLLLGYKRFKKEEKSAKGYVPSPRSSLWTKLKGTYRMIVGYVRNPEVDAYNEDLELMTYTNNEGEKVPHRVIEDGNDLKNQFGLVDYCTLFVPYHVEAFLRGHWISHPVARLLWASLFTIIPVLPIAWAVRTVIGMALMIPASIVTTITHLVEPAYDSWQIKKARESNYNLFNETYIKVRDLMKDNVVTNEVNGKKKIVLDETSGLPTLKDGLTDQKKGQILQEVSGHLNTLRPLKEEMKELSGMQERLMTLKEANEPNLELLDTNAKDKLKNRINKISTFFDRNDKKHDGKYSPATFENTFGMKI